MAACNTRQRLSEINPDGAKYFMDKLLFQIYEHFDEQYLIDVTFKLSNPSALVTAHRLILSASSPYFKELFKSDSGVCPVIEITDIDSDTFDHLITFCYTGKTFLTNDNVERILKAALILQLDDAVANCIDFVIENISDYTLQRVYALESENQSQILKQKIFEYETRNFMSVTQTDEYLNFDTNKLQRILESNTLNAPTEKDVFEAVKRWYEHDAVGRKQQLPDLINCLRLTQLDTNFLLTEVQPLPGCEFIAFNALSWIGCPSLRPKLNLKYVEQRGSQSRMLQELLFAFNKKDKTIFQYEKTEDVWQKWGDIKIDVSQFEVILTDENLIFVGGVRYNKAINEVASWNCKTKTVKRLPSLNEPRYLHSVVILNDTIYAIGGKGNGGSLKSVEMYTSNGWKIITSMIEPRYEAGAVAFNGKIYVMGGYCLRSVECYDPTTDRWTRVADMIDRRLLPGTAVYNGQIYAVGGRDDKEFGIPTVERYDPQRNEWSKICSLNAALLGVQCISIDNHLWAVGGCIFVYDSQIIGMSEICSAVDGRCGVQCISIDNQICIVVDCVSVYDEENDKWTQRKRVGLGGFYYCFTVPKVVFQGESEN